MKKIATFMLCLVCVLLVCAGCNQTKTERDPNTIIIGIPASAMVQDYDTNAYTLWLEETTGYNIEFERLASDHEGYSMQIATRTAANQELPDIIWHCRLGDSLIREYGDDGYFIDLKPYFEDKEKSAVFWERFESVLTEEEQNRVWQMIHSDSRTDGGEGPIYVFPTLETSLIDTMDFQPYINQEWLDRLNLEAPTDWDSLVYVLREFKTKDANGNGNPNDEVPMLGCKDGLGSNTLDWLINFFIYCNDTYYFNVGADGELYLPYIEDAYRDALLKIRELIEEGLLFTQVLSYTTTDLKAALSSTDRIGVAVGHATLIFDASSDKIMKWKPLNVYGNVYYTENRFFRETFITEWCVNPDAAWEVLMAMCSEEGALRMRYGIPGQDWDYADEGAESFMGLPATIKVYRDIWATPNNGSWMALCSGIYQYSENEANQPVNDASPGLLYKYDLFKEMRANYDAALAKTDKSQFCPWIRFNEEEDAAAGNYPAIRNAFVEWRALFLKGERDIRSDDDWNAYLAALEELGLRKYIAVANICYDRMYPNGHN